MERGENGERERERGREREREREKQRGKKRKRSSFISAVSIYSITKGIVYCIQRQSVKCIINKMCMHNEVWGCAEIFPATCRARLNKLLLLKILRLNPVRAIKIIPSD